MEEAYRLKKAIDWGRREAQQLHQWIANLVYLTDKIVGSKDPAEIRTLGALMWIRTHGVMSDLRRDLLKWNKLFEGEYPSTASSIRQVVNNIDYFAVEMLTESDHIIIDYLRQNQGHPLQSKYKLWIPDSTRGFTTLNKTFNMKEVDNILQRDYIKKFGDDKNIDLKCIEFYAPKIQCMSRILELSMKGYLNIYMAEVAGKDKIHIELEAFKKEQGLKK